MSCIIKDEDKLDFEFVPDELPHRGKELEKLDEMYSRILESKLSRHSLITGRSGYGKTVLAKYFFQNLREEGLSKGVNVELVFVNCKASHTPTRVMNKVMKDLRMSAGKNQDTMTDALKKWLIKNDSRLCVVVDEAHIPLKDKRSEGDRVIYCLSRINEIVSGPKVSVSVCLVSSKDVLSMLEESTQGMFKKNCIIELKGYSRDDLKDILVQRVELAFHPGTISTDCLNLLADISSGEGEARYGIELLLNAGLIAQQQGADEVTAEHIRRAKAEILPYVTEELLEELNQHEKLTL
jgi:cell division control protein 6